MEGCDRADGTPAASSRAGTAAPERSSARVARQRHCVEPTAVPEGRSGTMACPARPGGEPYSRALRGGFGHGVPEHRPSGPPEAAQRRTIGVIARRLRKGLRPRRWCAGGLLPSRYSRTGTLYREGCPAAPLCGAHRVAGRSSRHNGVPGTPRWGAIFPRAQGWLRTLGLPLNGEREREWITAETETETETETATAAGRFRGGGTTTRTSRRIGPQDEGCPRPAVLP